VNRTSLRDNLFIAALTTSSGARPWNVVGLAVNVGGSVGGSSVVGNPVVGMASVGFSVGTGEGMGVGLGGGRKFRATCSAFNMRWKVSLRSRLLCGWTNALL